MTTDISTLPIKELKRLLSKGIIKLELDPRYKGKDVNEIPVQDLADFQPFKHLAGMGVSLSEAARRYDIPQATISRWVARGRIKKIGMDKNRILIDEAMISYYAHKYKEMGAKSGSRTDTQLFDK